ncbi:MAG: 4-hydroxy-3-methylbut-2-enyl diphosphate reductase [Lentisphaerae bacterium]|nr:4-hydroxy-3-methylbut-2-enyl diphosphate reductase [Lentisphaerota bacterium]MBT4819600.1 4-hydroxy-3-methylbut-2-enyl diphosphate reductase [Lentisphaerota bacterium]MBT5610798.1 4-hydroxy-3-methylbut-2-enyl diphosphate reductase [Lentisphaerota bacterium]MBT7053770.1 4-hydroxy-3-methylbut-2-enyl diphosphate reductase [Lentisphaerota bacterium]MBT7841231.1 4-hydroxy-3-methylbut-2-enyl diphosphate reductase [Lentisphaerota bacterium]
MIDDQNIFHDADVEQAVQAGGIVRTRDRTLCLPSVFGFCNGVRQALELLQQTIDAHGGERVWLLGEIIHNQTVSRFFAAQGVRVIPEHDIDTVLDVATPSDIIVIPAFGVPLPLHRALIARQPSQVVDATCGYIKAIWRYVAERAEERKTILIHAKIDHPETRATISRALTTKNAVVLIPDYAVAQQVADAIRQGNATAIPAQFILHPDHLDLSRLAVVNQTTMLADDTHAIADLLQRAQADAGGQLHDQITLCGATQTRQDAARELCSRGCDLALVIGGYESSNTNQLFRLAQAFGPTYFIDGPQAIAPNSIRHYLPEHHRETETDNWLQPRARRVCLLAGASCPPSDIGGVIRALRLLT